MVLKNLNLRSSHWKKCEELLGGMDIGHNKEYVLTSVVPEMAYYFERNHSERFTCLFDKYRPDSSNRREQFNGAPVGRGDLMMLKRVEDASAGIACKLEYT